MENILYKKQAKPKQRFCLLYFIKSFPQNSGGNENPLLIRDGRK